MKRHLTLFLALASFTLASFFVGCAQLGAPPPVTFIDKVAVAQLSVTTARKGALTALNLGTLSAKDARTVQTAADNGNEAIDVAVGMYFAACPMAPPAASAPPAAPCTSTKADAKLAMATAILAAATAYLDKAAATQLQGNKP